MEPTHQKITKIQRALISVSDKTGLEQLGRVLQNRGVEILSSGGTAKFLSEKGLKVVEVSDFTGAPEMLDGRLKTLHPKIHGGILAIRDNSAHMAALREQKYVPIDLVVVNLYPFEAAARTPGKSFDDVVEQIDIGGPTLLRAASKNFPYVTALIEPGQYESFLKELETNDGGTTFAFRKECALHVFERTANYDATISAYFRGSGETLPKRFALGLDKKWELRYGENPHQEAGFYLPSAALGNTVLEKVLQGKTLSYNNLMDVHAALDLILELEKNYSVAILKHTNPCGVGTSDKSLLEAYERALSCDPLSAFGGIVVFSHPVDGQTASTCEKTFTEIVIAPKFDADARTVFGKKKNLRMLEADLNDLRSAMGGVDIRRAADGYLIQNRDRSFEDLRECKIATKRKPTEQEYSALRLAWTVAKHVKSNAIVLANETQTVGVGAGQMSRVDSSRIAAMKAKPELLKNVVLASDAFFPFRDGIDEAAKHGVRAVVQPGGSVRDAEVIQAADEHGMAMIFTGVRHFRH
ncbi:MAG TPA: bifunctional phosphoribosylaminoimidazolecarboxamide formyltransferase/IMP cyclohydrolase [Bdellovibrionota bacterium]|nr:bifunctional phosphoribosylaminoimidazolecarboxamide formyltransferase/IMP cyclohydrolase [Bdellovibrionota bacterium]